MAAFARRHYLQWTRLALSGVFLVFGALKLMLTTPVADLVGDAIPLIPQTAAVLVMGVVEVVIGLGILTGRAPWHTLALLFAVLLGTFSVFFTEPGIAFMHGNPLRLSLIAEFVIKNVCLISAGVVIAASIPPGAKRLPPAWKAQERRRED